MLFESAKIKIKNKIIEIIDEKYYIYNSNNVSLYYSDSGI